MIKTKKSVIFLVLANLVPLIGVLFLRWDFLSIILLYWAENIIIGFFNIFRILKAEKGVSNKFGNLGLAIFFVFHFGLFTFVHGVFIFALFGFLAGGIMSLPNIFLGFLSLFVSHAFSYFVNYIKKGEYKKISPKEAMSLPYKRIFILHFTILFGGFFVMSSSHMLGKSVEAPIIILFIFIKIIIDVFLHKKEHNNLQKI